MLIKNFKRINYLNFNLTETKFILNKDYFERQDLIDALEILFENKKTTLDSTIKWTEFDTIYNLKVTKLMIIPSIIDFQKDFLKGNKSIFKNLVNEIVLLLEPKNSNLIEIQNLLFNLKLENEFPLFNDLLKTLNQDLKMSFETNLSVSLAQIITDHYSLEITKNNEKLTENNIALTDLKKIYFHLLDCLQKCSENNLLLIFDDPFNGLNYSEMLELLPWLSKFKNKIVVASWLPKIDDQDLVNLCLWQKDWFLDFSNIFNDPSQYQKYIDSPIESIIESTLSEVYQAFNIYDRNFENNLRFQENDQEIFQKVLINHI